MANDLEQRLREGYRVMSERVYKLLQQAESTLEESLLKAREQAYALGELTREEAEAVATALKRDVEVLTLTLMQAEVGAKQWAETNGVVAEQRLMERALAGADPTTLELLRLKAEWQALEQATLQAGQEVDAGAYVCQGCGEVLHLTKPGTLPPCPHCHGTRFKPIPSAVM